MPDTLQDRIRKTGRVPPSPFLEIALVQDFRGRRVSQIKSGAKRQRIKGREDGRERTEPAAADPVWNAWDVEGYAALVLLVAVGRAGFGCGFVTVFLTACAFSFAANSALT